MAEEHGLLTDRFIDDVTALLKAFAIAGSRPEAQAVMTEIAYFAPLQGLAIGSLASGNLGI